MSLAVSLSSLDDATRRRLARDLVVREKPKKRGTASPPMWRPREIDAFRCTDDDTIHVPYDYGRKIMRRSDALPVRSSVRPLSNDSFMGELRPPQEDVLNECIHKINADGACLLSVHPGFGKTVIALRLTALIGVRTVILVNKLILMTQWGDSLGKFLPGIKTAIVLAKHTRVPTDSDVYIFNACNVEKFHHEIDNLGIGLVIVDECHLLMTSVFSAALTMLRPRYLIGLSATPYRSDGFDALLDLYFGKERVTRDMQRKHTVYAVHTGIDLEYETDPRTGKIVWNSLIESQSSHEARNNLIAEIARRYCTKRVILVLCKRVRQIESLVGIMASMRDDDGNEIPVATLYGAQTSFDIKCRVLIASIQKVGVGFSFDRLNMLILATDCEEYYIQYMCRVMRTPETEPIVVDIIDHEPRVLHRHFNTRRGVYAQMGGTVMTRSAKDFSG
jgi:superfamily II DNA or RNA helicase